MPVAAALLALWPLATSALPDPLTLIARSSDTNYTTEDGALTFVWPQYWVLAERYYQSLDGSNVGLVVMGDQAEGGSRHTKDMYVMHSTASAIFGLPASVTVRLSQKDLINYYIDTVMRNSIDPKISATSVSQVQGDTVYSIEWSAFTPGGLRFVNIEHFIFHGNSVYLAHGDYWDSNPAPRATIIATLNSMQAKDSTI
jgi:hypothetical protein